MGGIGMATVTRRAAPTVREATVDDIPRLVQMGQRFRLETGYASRIAENTGQMSALSERLIAGEDGLLLVSDREGIVTGMLGVLVFPHHLSGALVAGELFFWVEPDHRGHGVRLLKQAETWARANGATAFHMMAPSPEVERLYQRLGYTVLPEVTYEKRFTQEGAAPCP